MSEPERHIFASGGLLEGTGPDPLVDAMLLQVTASRPSVSHPRLVLLPTADETDLDDMDRIRQHLADGPVEVQLVTLYPRPNVADPAGLIGSADAVFASGGSTLSLLALWGAYGLDAALSDAWAAGTVLGGFSAGALCWFEAGLTSSLGPDLTATGGALGLLAGSFCPHYGDDPRRRRYLEEVAAGRLAPGLACDNGAVAHFSGRRLVEVLADVPRAAAWRVDLDDQGAAVECRLAAGPV